MILGEPDLKLRRSPLSIDECFKTKCSCIRTQLGVCINTINLTLSIPDNKHQDLVKILVTTWSSSRKNFALRGVDSLLGLVLNFALATQWVKYACISLHHATSLALKFNSNAVFTIGKHKYLTDLLRSKNINTKNFCLSKACNTAWNSKEKLIVTKSMQAEINLLYRMAMSPTAFLWEILIRHAIPKDCNFTVLGAPISKDVVHAV